LARRAPHEPAALEQRFRQCGRQRTGEVVPSLCPVETRAQERSPTGARRGDVDARPFEPALAFLGQLQSVRRELDRAELDQVVVHAHTELAGEVVVAEPRRSERRRGCARAQRARRDGRADGGERLERLRDVWARQAVVAAAALAEHRHDPAVEQAAQVSTRRGRPDAGEPGELTGRERAAVEERRQHGGTCRFADEPCDHGDVDVEHTVDGTGPTFRPPAKCPGCSIAEVLRPTTTPRPPSDPFDAVTHPDPWPYYAQLRARGVHLDASTRTWVVPNAVTIASALCDRRLGVRPPGEPVPPHLIGTCAGEVFGRLARTNDDERHDVLRAHADTLVASIAPGRVRSTARAIARRVGADLRSGADVDCFLDAVPALTIATELGLDVHDAPLVRAISDLTAAFRPAADPANAPAASDAARLLLALVGTDVGQADCDDRRANAVGLLFQTFDATAGLVGTTLTRLASDTRSPTSVAATGRTDDLVGHVLRTEPPVHNTRRYASAATTIAGHRVERGDTVVLVLAAAASERLAFGAGRHRCPADRIAASICAGAVDALLEVNADVVRLCIPRGFRPSPAIRVPVFSAPRRHHGVRPTRRS
jgi:cytochrome P450